jgi:Uma2 family endonuclease
LSQFRTLAPLSAAKAQELEPPPLLLPPDLRLTPEQFERMCQANPEAVLELDAIGRLIVMTPTGGETSGRNSRLTMRLLHWADQRSGWRVFNSSGGGAGQPTPARRPAGVQRLEAGQEFPGLSLDLAEIWGI